MKNMLITGAIAVVAAMVVAATPFAAAEEESEDQIKYRQAVMEAIGGHTSAASLIARGLIERDELALHARALQTLTADIPALFPEGSDFGDTRAKDEIWEEWDDFVEASNASKASAEKLVAAVESGGDIAGAFRDVGDGCKGCHRQFRRR